MIKSSNMLQTIKELDAKLNSYTEESTVEDRTKVIDKTTGEEGIVVNSDGDKIVVRWIKTGSMKEYTKKSLDNVNSEVCYTERLMTKLLSSQGTISIVVPTTSTKPVPEGGSQRPHTSALVTFPINQK